MLLHFLAIFFLNTVGTAFIYNVYSNIHTYMCLLMVLIYWQTLWYPQSDAECSVNQQLWMFVNETHMITRSFIACTESGRSFRRVHLPPWCHWQQEIPLVTIIDCRLVNAKPLPEQSRLQNVGHFVTASMYYCIDLLTQTIEPGRAVSKCASIQPCSEWMTRAKVQSNYVFRTH